MSGVWVSGLKELHCKILNTKSEWYVIKLIHTLHIAHNLVLVVQAHSTDWLSPESSENVKTTKVGPLDGVNLYFQTQTTHIVHHLILVKETWCFWNRLCFHKGKGTAVLCMTWRHIGGVKIRWKYEHCWGRSFRWS